MSPKIEGICFSPYQLHTDTKLNAKASTQNHLGCLLRFEFQNIGYGYADCRPWPELGDASLPLQLNMLSQFKSSPLLQKSIAFALRDAQARAQKKWLLENFTLPRNRFTATRFLSVAEIENLHTQGFQKIKLKCGIKCEEEIDYLKKMADCLQQCGMQWQLDFNGSLNVEQCESFLESCREILPSIDCIEDPLPFHAPFWQKIQSRYGVSLALDRIPDGYEPPPHSEGIYQVLVLKPALAEKKDLLYFSGRVIFTSYFDHPLGQLCALYEAAQFYAEHPIRAEDCGFLTHLNYAINSYSEQLQIQSTKLIPPCGTGFGFDDLLIQENWRPLEHN